METHPDEKARKEQLQREQKKKLQELDLERNLNKGFAPVKTDNPIRGTRIFKVWGGENSVDPRDNL